MISNQAVEQAAYDIMAKAAIDIPEDYLGKPPSTFPRTIWAASRK